MMSDARGAEWQLHARIAELEAERDEERRFRANAEEIAHLHKARIASLEAALREILSVEPEWGAEAGELRDIARAALEDR